MKRLIALLLALAAPCAAAAQEAFPSRPITLIAAYPPGGNTDLMARAIQPELQRALGQTVVVVNRGGAAGNLGAAVTTAFREAGARLVLVERSRDKLVRAYGGADSSPK